MAYIDEFTVKDVRCFAGEHTFNFRPLTFLVGENSTGKSSVLGSYHALTNMLNDMRGEVDFNIPPYRMGSFIDIARYVGGRGGKCDEFELGIGIKGRDTDMNLVFGFRMGGSEPVVYESRLIFNDSGERVIFGVDNGTQNEQDPRGPSVKSITRKGEIWNVKLHAVFLRQLPNPIFLLEGIAQRYSNNIEKNPSEKNLKSLEDLFRKKFTMSLGKVNTFSLYKLFRDNKNVSMAPIRSEPKRTYDLLTERKTPEGDDIPMSLMKLKRAKRYEEISKKLQSFGEKSGLFEKIFVRTLGNTKNDPFQLEVKVKGPKVNIMDAGYGISQILPILVRIFESGSRNTFLLQQPEVHLHPRGQAELTSQLVESVKNEENRFIVETHSDYMIDRARICIRKGLIAPKDVSLIYFEPCGNQVESHNIEFDEQSNMINVPGSYRSFFLKESDSLLGFEE